MNTAAIIFSAGRGTRMKGYEGNKTLLPLIPGNSPFAGTHPILLEIIKNLPDGPKAVVVNHRKDDVINASLDRGLTYCEQHILNGTGGALLAAKNFIKDVNCDNIIITMGDVPFVKKETYTILIDHLKNRNLVVLGFKPKDKKKYGVLKVNGNTVSEIIEWEYWKNFSEETQKIMTICNSGIYAFRRQDLLTFIPVLEDNPHIVTKEINGQVLKIDEYFITDLIKQMSLKELRAGYILSGDESEVMGIDDLEALTNAQQIFKKRAR